MLAQNRPLVAVILLGGVCASTLASAGPIEFYRAQNTLIRMDRVSSISSSKERIGLSGNKKKGFTIVARSADTPDSNWNHTMQARKINAMSRHLDAMTNHIDALASQPAFAGSERQAKLATAVRAMKVSDWASVPIRAEGLGLVYNVIRGKMPARSAENREDAIAARYGESYRRFRVAANKLNVDFGR